MNTTGNAQQSYLRTWLELAQEAKITATYQQDTNAHVQGVWRVFCIIIFTAGACEIYLQPNFRQTNLDRIFYLQ
jgi:hypothetical protein